MSVVFHSDPPPTLDTGLRARVADLRARGQSWDTVAAAIHWDVIELLTACRTDELFPAALAQAQQELDDEAQAEGLHRLRELLRCKRSEVALRAAQIITEHNAQKRRDATRLELERRRCATRLEVEHLRARARAGRAAPARPDEGDRALTGDEQRQVEAVFWRAQERHAEEARGGFSEVFVWGGKHTIGEPPDESDRRVVLIPDRTVVGRKVFWVMSYPGMQAAGAMLSGTGGPPAAGAVPVPVEGPPELFATRDTITREQFDAELRKK